MYEISNIYKYADIMISFFVILLKSASQYHDELHTVI